MKKEDVMQRNLNNQYAYPCQVRKIKLFAFFLLIFFQPAFLCAADFAGKLKGVTITDQAVTNAPPTAVITYTQSGTTFTFDGGGSTDSDGSIAQYKWDFGDGGLAATAVAQHQFLTPGETVNVTLNTIDDKGAVALAQVSFIVPVVYEDAEDGSIDRWTIWDNVPAGAVITNVFDDVRNSRVIDLKGTLDTSNGYKLTKNGGALWGNVKNLVIQWSNKASYSFEVFIDCQTSAGHRYLKYTAGTTSPLGTGDTVTYGLGPALKNGSWQTFSRDLVADLKAAQPGVTITSVNAFLIRGTGRVDDIILK